MSPDRDLPVPWVAPEGFNGQFSIKSDVSVVLLWEVFSYGAVPFGTCSMSHCCPLSVKSHPEIKEFVCNRRQTLLNLQDRAPHNSQNL